MKCETVRNRILAVEDPNHLPGELEAHLSRCEGCRRWARRFASVERALTQIPVAPSEGFGKIAVLEYVRSATPPAKSTPATPAAKPKKTPEPAAPIVAETPVVELPAVLRDPSSNHRAAPVVSPATLNLEEDLPKKKWSFGQMAAKFWPAGLVAATLLIGSIAWISLRGNKAPKPPSMPADPMLESLVRLNVELSKTETAAERVKVLARVADELHQEMREIARADATGEDMQALEKMYRDVVLDGLISQAKLVDRGQREQILTKVADGLIQASQRAEKTAQEAPEHSATPLRDAASAAKDGNKRLRLLIREASL